MDEYQSYAKFSVDGDFERGEWIDGEFYAATSARKSRKTQTKDDSLYGVFQESDSDDDRGGGGKRRRRDGGGLVVKGDLTKPLNFVSKGMPPSVKAEDANASTPSEAQELAPWPALDGNLGFGGVGSGSGLGYSGGVKQEGGDDDAMAVDEEEDGVPKTALLRRIYESAERKAQEDKERAWQQEKEKMMAKQAAVGLAKPASTVRGGTKLGDIGAFEKHTKGIGLKLLEKMGYRGGGLGKAGQGIVTPVEATLRKKGEALGFGTSANDGKLQGYGRDMETEEPVEKAKVEKPRTDEKLWKRKNAGRRRQEYKTAAQLLEEKQADGREATQKIIDMRGSQVLCILGLSTERRPWHGSVIVGLSPAGGQSEVLSPLSCPQPLDASS